MSGCSDQPVDISTVKKNAEVHGYTYLRPLTNPSLKDDPHATREGGAHRLPDTRAVVGGDFAGDDDPPTGCHHLVAGRGARVIGGAGGAHDLVNLVPIHIRLLPETLGHGDKRAGDGSTGGGVFAEQAELGDRLLALHIPANACAYASIKRGATKWEQPR